MIRPFTERDVPLLEEKGIKNVVVAPEPDGVVLHPVTNPVAAEDLKLLGMQQIPVSVLVPVLIPILNMTQKKIFINLPDHNH